MTLRFIDGLPVLGYCELDEHTLAFAWNWHEPTLRVTAIGESPHLVGHITHLDGFPRLATGPDFHGRLDEERIRAVLDQGIDLWRRKERMFRDCEG